MSYSVKELRDKLPEKILGLGIDPKFKDNPAYASAVAGIDSFISQMNIMSDSDKVMVTEMDGKISFSYEINGNKNTLEISSKDKDSFECVKTTSNKPIVSDGKMIDTKQAIGQVAKLDDHNGYITITTNVSNIDNVDCKKNEHNERNVTDKKVYSNYGIMMTRNYQGYKSVKIPTNMDNIDLVSAVDPTRPEFNGIWRGNDNISVQRTQLDVAEVHVSENMSERVYHGNISLAGQERGLRDLPLPLFSTLSEEVIIPEIDQDDINKLIESELNEKVQEGLRKMSVNRSKYSYNSMDDPRFEYKDGRTDVKLGR